MTSLLGQLGAELHRMIARRRTHIGFCAFVAIELVLLYFLQFERVRNFWRRPLEQFGYAFDDYFSALTLGMIILAMSIFLLGALFLALVSGDIVAKESEDGTLRMLLSRPVTRFRLLVAKFLACAIYTACLVIFLGITAFIVGVIERGWGGGMFAMIPELGVFSVFDWGTGLTRYALGLLLLTVSMNTVTSLGFCLSNFRMKPAAATILTVSLFFIDFVVSKMPALSEFRHWFITPRIDDWALIFRETVPWWSMARSYVFLFGFQVTCFVIGWLALESRDLKS